MRMIDKAYQGMAARALVINAILQRVLDYAKANAITTPKGATLKALNAYCNQLEADGILSHTGAGGVPTSASDFTTLDVFVNFAYNDVGLDKFSLIDWIRLVEMDIYGGVTYTSQGYEGNGVDGYIDTLYNPTTQNINYQLQDAHRAVIQYKNILSNQAIAGMTAARNRWFRSSTNAGSQFNSANTFGVGRNNRVIGLMSESRVGFDINWVDLAAQGQQAVIDTVSFSSNYFLLRRESNFSPLGLSYASFGKSVGFALSQDFRTATNTYLSAIGLTPIA